MATPVPAATQLPEYVDPYFPLPILELTKQARGGVFHDYPAVCTRRLRRIRHALHFLQGKKTYVKRPLTYDLVTDPRYLHIPLMEAERAWATALDLKKAAQSSGGDLRVYAHAKKRLRKAARFALQLVDLTKKCADQRSIVEAEAYALWMRGQYLLEEEKWAEALLTLVEARIIYEELSRVATTTQRELATHQVEELEAPLRVCHYKIVMAQGGAPPSADQALTLEALLAMLTQERVAMMQTRRAAVHTVLVDFQAKQPATVTEVTWQGVTIPVRDHQVRHHLQRLHEAESSLAALLQPLHADPTTASLDYWTVLGHYDGAVGCCGDLLEAIQRARVEARNETATRELKALQDYVKSAQTRLVLDRGTYLADALVLRLGPDPALPAPPGSITPLAGLAAPGSSSSSPESALFPQQKREAAAGEAAAPAGPQLDELLLLARPLAEAHLRAVARGATAPAAAAAPTAEAAGATTPAAASPSATPATATTALTATTTGAPSFAAAPATLHHLSKVPRPEDLARLYSGLRECCVEMAGLLTQGAASALVAAAPGGTSGGPAAGQRNAAAATQIKQLQAREITLRALRCFYMGRHHAQLAAAAERRFQGALHRYHAAKAAPAPPVPAPAAPAAGPAATAATATATQPAAVVAPTAPDRQLWAKASGLYERSIDLAAAAIKKHEECDRPDKTAMGFLASMQPRCRAALVSLRAQQQFLAATTAAIENPPAPAAASAAAEESRFVVYSPESALAECGLAATGASPAEGERTEREAAGSFPVAANVYRVPPAPLLATLSLTPMPPKMQPIPCKPVLFDIALSSLQFPSLEARKKKKAGGLFGFLRKS
ncbi:putative signal recognition particle 68 kDa protein [Paratrimastix pyriformis]|uniref:Signal recognition particle subunit SRP68 n=1 Tax=Paratrimastix pyriformis TaxID=342808 RepID=A0ABQ8U6U6_9EUKA|nr:putative signal recognition particle 68 kDa protein [Paratrimastix pyriformis]